MSTHRFRLDALPETPWRNGGGATCEIACWPPGAGMDDFDWRLSVARIAADGPFSLFPGVDRSILLLEGDGVRLRSRTGGLDHRLDRPWVPFGFSGDLALECALLGGPSRDFNVMVRRGRMRAQLRVLDAAGALAATLHGLLLAWRGDWSLQRGGGCELLRGEQREGLWWADERRVSSLSPDSADARLLAVAIEAAA